MATDTTLARANIALQVLIKHAESNQEISFRDLMDEIITRWNSDFE